MKHALLASVAILMAIPAIADAQTKPAQKPRLFTNAEAAKATTALKKRLVATKSCPRPVLRGVAKKGSARTDLYALFEGKDACGARIDKLAAKSKGSGTVISKMMSDPQVLEFQATCGEKLAAKVTNAAARESACSPYEIGVRDIPDAAITRYFVTAAMLGQHATTIASTRPVAALQLLLDGVRVFHDLTRGRTNATTHVLALNALLPLIQTAHDILEAPNADPSKLIPVVTEVDALLASAPTAHTLLGGEGDAIAVWTTAKAPRSSRLPAPVEFHPADEKALMLHVGADLTQLVARLCPTNGTYAECKKMLETAPSSTTSVETLMTELAASASSEEARKRAQSAIVAILRDLSLSGLSNSVGSSANSIFRLASLRLHLEAVLAKKCPEGKNWETQPWLSLRNPPRLGDQLTISSSNGTVTIAPPVWYAKRDAYTFICPTK